MDVGQVRLLAFPFFLRDEVEVNKNAEKNEANTEPF